MAKKRTSPLPVGKLHATFSLADGARLQLALSEAEGVAAAHVARLEAKLEPLHALCGGAVGEALGL